MPTISVHRDELWRELGQRMTEEAFDHLCFEFGIELDDVLEDGTYKIDIPANRYDLLCLEGLSRALRVFLEKEDVPRYRVVAPPQPQQLIVKPAVKGVRPVVVCAVLRDVSFDETRYQSFIDLQDKLHQNICHKRKLVSIGTHDLDTIRGPFFYDAKPPQDIRFVPLNKHAQVNAVQLFEDIRQNDLHLKPYLHIIENSELYPVIYDSNGTVLSLPPIINGDVSKISLATKNVFIEVTALDQTKAEIVLNTMVTMFSVYCKDKFAVEAVSVVPEKSDAAVLYPNLSLTECRANIHYINGILGLKLSAAEMQKLLRRMCVESEVDKDEIVASVPATRSDILHAVDIVEDVGIAYGFNNLPVAPPPTLSLGKQDNLMRLTEKLRLELAFAGFTEALTLSLCSKEEAFSFLNKEDDGSAVVIANPKTVEFQIGRPQLLVGILKTLTHNQGLQLPIKLFEVSDVMYCSDESDVGASNRRHLCAAFCGNRSGFEDIHGLVDRLMLVLGVAPTHVGDVPKRKNLCEYTYRVQLTEDPTFISGRCASVLVTKNGVEKAIGTFGVIHPSVLKSYKLPHVCSALELDVEEFL